MGREKEGESGSMWHRRWTWINLLESNKLRASGEGRLIEKLEVWTRRSRAADTLIYATRAEYNVSGSPIGFSDQLAVKAKLSVCRGGLKFRPAKLRGLAIG